MIISTKSLRDITAAGAYLQAERVLSLTFDSICAAYGEPAVRLDVQGCTRYLMHVSCVPKDKEIYKVNVHICRAVPSESPFAVPAI